jgi:exopolyphosphatase / guanosine-5'-triphosphate,3'-diphosphate pyrophosphatase
MTRVAAIDCGTNTLRLLIADHDPATGRFTDVDRDLVVVRLGQGVDRTGQLAPEALQRTLDAVKQYADRCAAAGVTRLRFVATSATRDAGNRDEFVAGVLARIGVEPEVLSGEDEARLTFVGATRGLNSAASGTAGSGVLVVDIGGGSTEVVLGDGATGRIVASTSVDIGCVRLTERHHLGAGRVTPSQMASARADVEAALDAVEDVVPLSQARRLVGVAGTVTTVTSYMLRQDGGDPGATHGAQMTLAQAKNGCVDLMSMRTDERAALPGMMPGRADVLGAGALVWLTVLDRVAARTALPWVTTSEQDILDGVAWSLVEPA